MGHALGRVADHTEGLTRLECLEQHHGSAGVEDRVAVAIQATGVEQRENVEVHGVEPHSSGNAEVHAVPEVHAVGDHRPFGQPGRSRRVHDRDDVVVGERDPWRGLSIERGERLLVGSVGLAAVDLDEGVDRAKVLEFGGCCGELDVVEQDLRRRVVEYVFEFTDGEPPVEQDTDGAVSLACELDIEELDAVVGEDRDTVAASDSDRRQVGGHGVDSPVEVGVGK